MTYPYFRRGIDEGGTSAKAEHIVPERLADDPGGYIPHKDLSHAVNVALVLGMPLLLTGEPGTGKTQLAYTLAADLGVLDADGKPRVLKFETKSTSQSRDLFYTFDAIGAFKVPPDKPYEPRDFIRYQALGQAILEAFDPARVADLWPPSISHEGPRRAVVLIDEIDKAPRDFPNDLLNEIDRLYFRVPELGNRASPGADKAAEGVPPAFRPIVVLTSNSEKGLPDPFLRRCVYFDIPFPEEEEMRKIVNARIRDLHPNSQLMSHAIDLFYCFRKKRALVRLKKEPSTAELLNWVQMLRARGLTADDRLSAGDNKDKVLETLFALIKNSEDLREAKDFVANRWKP